MSDKIKKPVFVVHKHAATHLHYDLRLERRGVLKSWAVPKEPPKQEGIKRLAIQVADHNLDYANFEGKIPEGSYGAGNVRIWDKGHYLPVKAGPKEFIFELEGKKLKGVYCLIKLKTGLPKDKNWILFKKESTEKVKK